MTVQSTDRTAGPFIGNGTQTAFPFSFRVFANTDLLLTRTDTSGVQTELVLSSDYIVSVNADQSTNPGGTVALLSPLPSGYVLEMTTALEPTQLTDITNAGGFYPRVIENALDKMTILLQQQGVIGRQTIRVPETSGVPVLPAAAARANKILGFDSAGAPVVLVGADPNSATALQVALADTASSATGGGMLGYSWQQAYAGWTVGGKLRESLSLLDFIPPGLHAAIRNFTSSADVTTYINAAFAAANGRRLFAPAGLYNHAQLQVPKACKLALVGEFSSYNDTEGTVFNYTGTGIGLQLGVDDGNPDSTGPARGGEVRSIHFKTSAGATAVRMQNTALASITDCVTRGFGGKIIDLRANVITTVRDNDIAGVIGTEGIGQGSYGIWCDDQYFGNFVVDIENNHIFQVNHAGRFSEGRGLRVYNNVIENIRPGAAGGVWEFSTAGYISVASFEANYYENHRGYVYEGSGFTGAILLLSIKREDGWGSTDASHVNPGVGNLPKTKVIEHDVSGNLFVDSAFNTAGALALPSVYPSTSVFDVTQTIVRSQVTGREYEDDLVHAMRSAEMLQQVGDFCMVTGGTAGTMTITGAGATPAFWTNLATPQWQLIPDTASGTWVCHTPIAGDFDRCSRSIALTPVNRTRYFVIAFTTKGWSALAVDGVSKYDSGANVPNWHTEVIRFSIAPNASSFTLKFMTNAGNPFYIAEARMAEIGSAEFNEPGTANGVVTRAAKRLLKRGSYS